MTERTHLSRRQFLKIGSTAAGWGLLGTGLSRAQAAGKANRPNILAKIAQDHGIDIPQ